MLMCWGIERLFLGVSSVWLAAPVGGVAALASRLAGQLMIAREAAHGGANALATFAPGFGGKRTIA